MTLTQLIARFKSLASYDLDVVGETLSDLEITDYLNQAQAELAKRARWFSNKISFSSAANQGVYGLRSGAFDVPLIQITLVILDKNPLKQLSMESLERRFPSWRTDPPGTPEYSVLPNGSELILYPTPLVATENNYVAGYCLPVPLSLDTPGVGSTLPEEIHTYIASLAVVLAAEPMATEPQQLNRLSSLRANAYQLAETLRIESESAVKGVDWQGRGRAKSLNA